MDIKKELPSGKLSPEALERNVLSYSGAENKNLLIGPAVGEDAAVIKWDSGKYMIFASDPISGASKGAGKLLVRVNSNDIASKGGDPLYMTVTLMLPPETGEEGAAAIMKEVHEECLAQGISVAGGHTEFNDLYTKPVIMAALVGEADRVFDARNIEAGDYILVTKHIGIEGMSILAADKRELLEDFMSEEETEELLSWGEMTSVLKDSRVVREYAKFMHDPTEGGFYGGLGEITSLCGLEAEIDTAKIPLHPLTVRASVRLGFDPLHLIASGSLLAVIAKDSLPQAEEALKKADIPYAVIGKMGGKLTKKPKEPKEELWRLLKMEK